MDPIVFRAAESSDAAALGIVHVASWRETYAGILPERILHDLSADARSAMWTAILNDPVLNDPGASGGTAIFVAESDGTIIGFGACGRQRVHALEEQGFAGEIGALYVLRSRQRSGVGRSLMRLMARSLLAQGRTTAFLWVLRENASARTFYEHLGGVLVAERRDEQSGLACVEVAYGWKDLSPLIR